MACLNPQNSERAFSFTPNEYLSIHRKLFTGIYSHGGGIRDYNITKKEWVLNGATVLYGSATELLPGQTIFGRSDAMKVIDIKASRASDLLREMVEHGIIEPVVGHGSRTS